MPNYIARVELHDTDEEEDYGRVAVSSQMGLGVYRPPHRQESAPAQVLC